MSSDLTWPFEPNPETVLLAGAGLLKAVPHLNNLESPLANDFLATAYAWIDKGHPITALEWADALREWLSQTYGYTEHDLRTRQDLNIEKIFTDLDKQASEDPGLAKAKRELDDILIELLTAVTHWDLDDWSGFDAMGALGSWIVENHGAVVTFNYDITIERAIERAIPLRFTGLNVAPEGEESIRDQGLGVHSTVAYERPLAYGFRFDVIKYQRRLVLRGGEHLPPEIDGRSFYGANGKGLYRRPVLKLHGSLNWLTPNPDVDRPTMVLGSDGFGGDRGLAPRIITPLQNKPYDRYPFPELWAQARELVAQCKRLVVVGYSFPDTDVAVRAMLTEALDGRPVAELIVVNPSDDDAALTATLIPHASYTQYGDLRAFLRSEGTVDPYGSSA